MPQWKKVKTLKSIKNLINNSKSSSIEILEEECDNIKAEITEKNVEISNIKKAIEKTQSSEEIEKKQVALRYNKIMSPFNATLSEGEIREITSKYKKQQELNNHKKYLFEQEKWIFEKQESIYKQMHDILLETQMHSYHWKKNPDEILQKLGHLSREFQFLQETLLGTLQTHWEVLQDLRNTHNNLERTNLSAEERADLANTHRLQSDRLIWLERWNKHLAKQAEPKSFAGGACASRNLGRNVQNVLQNSGKDTAGPEYAELY